MSEFTVDLQDPESIALALGRAQQLVEKAEEQYSAAMEELERAASREGEAKKKVERWRAMTLTLRNAGDIMAAASAEADLDGGIDADIDLSSKDRALQVVTAIGGPTNIAEVAEHMPQFNPKTVSWALWKLAEEDAIQKLGNGRYAPRGYTVAPIKIPSLPGRPTGKTVLLDGMAAVNAKVRQAAIERAKLEP